MIISLDPIIGFQNSNIGSSSKLPTTHSRNWRFIPNQSSSPSRLLKSDQVVRSAAELRHITDLQFDSSSAKITAIRLSGTSEKAYIRSYNVKPNRIGVKNKAI
uniref:Putative origin recognition complex, subunit 6, metazoa/plant n=1 Tax=Helianthus annuus TaxID=4232 RepID=A0A251SVJ2_HELAN